MFDLKKDFPIFKKHKNMIYLDSASTSQKPKIVIDRVKKYYEEENSNIGRGAYDLSEISSKEYQKARRAVCHFINCHDEELIFVRNTTEAINLVAYSLSKKMKKTDEILVSLLEHHSNFVVWQQLSKLFGFKVKYVEIDKEKGIVDLKDLEKNLNKNTKLIALSHASNSLGTLQPVEKVIEMAHKKGAYVLLDGAQTVPHMKINVKTLDCDFLAFSGHKMLGPMGIGVLYGKKEILKDMDPFIYGGGMVIDSSKKESKFVDLPEKFEAGTPNVAGAVGFSEAINYLQSNLGMEKVQDHVEELTKYCHEKLSTINKVKVLSPKLSNIGVISFIVDKIHPHDIAHALNQHNICVRAGKHCNHPLMNELGCVATTRVSFYIYNDKKDIDLFIKTLKKIIEEFS